MLTASQSEELAILWDVADPGDYDITIALNDDGTGTGPLDLCTVPSDTH